MQNTIFEVTDKTGRKIHLKKEGWKHITSTSSLHAYMANHLEEIKETLIKPDKITKSSNSEYKVNYFKYYKERARYLKAVVKYLNGNGFVIAAYFTKNIKN